MGMAPLCFGSSTRSAINDIVCRAAEKKADSHTVYKIVAAAPASGRTRGYMPPERERPLQLPDKNTDLRLLVQDWYKGAPTVVTTNICLPLGVGSNTTDRIGRILFPETAVHFPGLTDGQFLYMLPQIQALFVTLPNLQFTIMSNAFAPSPGAA